MHPAPAPAENPTAPADGSGPFDGFTLEHVHLSQVELRVRYGGSGPPIVLLHGHPRTHFTWHAVAPILATRFTVVCPDLRGYGGSSKPDDLPDHAQASKRAMAGDVLELMRLLGLPKFAVVGHDRGAYVAFRTALDHPEAVSHLVVLDAVPIAEALRRADARFAQAWWHWFFFAQPSIPERAILADPDAWYGNGPDSMGQENFDDYHVAIHDPATVHAMVEDYRAGLGVDRAADDADLASGRTVAVPTLVLWAARDDLGDLYGDPLAVWRAWATDLRGHRLDSGHHMAEEIPAALADEIGTFVSA
jgi:haloacetate dehalogenase